jgi:hypothetical protein
MDPSKKRLRVVERANGRGAGASSRHDVQVSREQLRRQVEARVGGHFLARVDLVDLSSSCTALRPSGAVFGVLV